MSAIGLGSLREAGQRFLALAGLVLLGLSAISTIPVCQHLGPYAFGALLVIGLWGVVAPGPGAAIAITAAALSGSALLGLVWQAVMPIALLALAALARFRPRLGIVRPPLGAVPGWGTAICAAVTPIALICWLRLADGDVADLVAAVPHAALPLLILGGAGFALVNALFEELVWRGVFQARLLELFTVPMAIGIQAASFGIVHVHGFPRGVSGVILAGVWAAMLGMLRQRAGGLLAPVLAHIVADATIAIIIISRAR